ncbi:hypothetical protein E4V42_10850 [Clostridium estertheticum]|nr:hypothetical protein [Clostridium estertheticum]
MKSGGGGKKVELNKQQKNYNKAVEEGKNDKGVSEASNNKIFTSEKIEWTATRPKGTQQTYEIYQRNDIEWDMIRTSGDKNFIGKTNAEAAGKGLPPQLSDGNFSTLHHTGQDSRGAIAEASTRYHGVGKYGQDILYTVSMEEVLLILIFRLIGRNLALIHVNIGSGV